MNSQEDIEYIIDQYKDLVYRIAIIYIKNKYDADDIFQNVFLALVKKKIFFDNDAHCKAWLIRTTINYCKKYFYYNKKEILKVKKVSEQFYIQKDNSILEEVGKLPQKYRTVIELYYFEDLSCYEIANIFKINYATVRKQLSRGREQLKCLLPDEYM